LKIHLTKGKGEGYSKGPAYIDEIVKPYKSEEAKTLIILNF
jgi:hypothetical protein